MNHYDSSGRKLQLGQLLGRGGEGAVYELAGPTPPRVAKLYHAPPATAKVDKVRAMIASAHPSMLTVAAWPLDTIHAAPNGPVTGLVMPKVTGYGEIHLLYSPAHRRSDFPRADWGHLVHAARNVAAAVETVHARGHVVGDVNQKNFTVAANATVMLVDCDSFQISHGGLIYPCEVGVAHFTPPELQGRPFHTVRRTANHDAFGLAVLCFHLLFMGRHPFAGRYHGAGDMPIERAIREWRFSFGAAARRVLMEPPPGALPLAAVPPAVAALFEEAFGQSTADARPPASQWRLALDALSRQLKTCARVGIHKFFDGLTACVWCELEGRTGVVFFLDVTRSAAAGLAFDIAATWMAIERVGVPLPLPALPQPTFHGITPRPLDGALMARRRAAATARIAVPIALITVALIASISPTAVAFLIVLATVIPLLPLPGRDEQIKRKAAFEAADTAWRQIQQRWLSESRSNPFSIELEALRRKRDAYRELHKQYARERDALEKAKRAKQLEQFLEKYFLDHAKIPKIGSGRKATLASFGIETAADVTYGRLASVPGFGPTLVASLVHWRATIESRFTFDPSRHVDPQEVSRLQARFAPKRRELEPSLLAGAARLSALREQVEAHRARLRVELEVSAADWARARADLDAMKIWRRN